MLMGLLANLPPNMYKVHNIHMLDFAKSPPPPWLNGTPLIIDMSKRIAIRGTRAIETLSVMSNNSRSHQNQASTASPSSTKPNVASTANKTLPRLSNGRAMGGSVVRNRHPPMEIKTGNVTPDEVARMISKRNQLFSR